MTVDVKAIVAVAMFVAFMLAGCATPEAGSDEEWARLTPEQLDRKLRSESVLLVNVHVPYEGEIPGTDAFIPYTKIGSRTNDLTTDDATLVLYCRSGSMSTEAARVLAAAGYTGFAELANGFNAWRAAELPFEVNPAAK